MAKIINLTNKLNNEPSFIILGDNKKFKVNDCYKAVLEATTLFEEDGIENVMKGLEVLLGKGARKEIENLPISGIREVMKAVVSIISGQSEEEVEARFQQPEGDK